MKNYPISYTVKSGSFTAEYLKENDLGGCDALIIHSIMMPEDGSRSETIVAINQKGDILSSDEIFKSWVHMAHGLARSLPSGSRRKVCQWVFDSVKEAILEVRRKNLK